MNNREYGCVRPACYMVNVSMAVVASLSPLPIVGLVACALTGLCTAMLWPGSLIVASDRFPSAGVAVFALMAAGGDLGGAIGTQLVGSAADLAMSSAAVTRLAETLGLGAESPSMKLGLSVAVIFPLVASILYIRNYIVTEHERQPKQ